MMWEEIGKTVRDALGSWPRTIRLICLAATAIACLALLTAMR